MFSPANIHGTTVRIVHALRDDHVVRPHYSEQLDAMRGRSQLLPHKQMLTPRDLELKNDA